MPMFTPDNTRVSPRHRCDHMVARWENPHDHYADGCLLIGAPAVRLRNRAVLR
jgi:hypothetical protein